MSDVEFRLLLPIGDRWQPISCIVDEQTTVQALETAVRNFLAGQDGNAGDRAATGGLWCRRLGELRAPDRVVDVGLRHGDVVGLAPISARRAGDGAAPVVRLGVVGGSESGTVWRLAPGRYELGRAPHVPLHLDDPDVSRQHAALIVEPTGVVIVEDLDSANGTFIDGVRIGASTVLESGAVLEVGSSLLRLLTVQPRAAVASDGPTIRFNRPPRTMPPADPAPITVAAPPEAVRSRRISMAALLAPLVIGVGTAVIFGPKFLIIAVLSPLAFLWQQLDDRRADKREHREKVTRFSDEVTRAVENSLAAGAGRLRAAHDRHPGAADLLEQAATLSAQLWQRRPDDADFLTIRCGWSDLPASPPVVVTPGGDPALQAQAQTAITPLLTDRCRPVTVDLAAGHCGVVGVRDGVDGVVRAMIAQLVTEHSPRDVVLVAGIAESHTAGWDFLSLLPHVSAAVAVVGGPPVTIGRGESGDAADDLIRRLVQLSATRVAANNAGAGSSPSPHVVVVLDADSVHRSAAHRLLEVAATAAITVIWLGSTRESLPGMCTTVLELVGNYVNVAESVSGRRVDGCVVDVLNDAYLVALAADLAPLVDEAAYGAAQLPAVARLSTVLDLPTLTVESIRSLWARGSHTSLTAPIGIAQGEPFVLDLMQDGPHALVGGTTGAGKSELLQTWVSAMAATHPPEEVTFFLIDYKGGAAFHACVALPHTVGFVTDLDPHMSNRALAALNAELHHREGVLATHGAKDRPTLRRQAPDVLMPSMVIVIDEFATLVKEIPAFVDGIINVAQRGRSLGVHLILATQRPAGAVNDNVRANTNLRIALRMNDAQDSTDVIAVPDAARLSRSQPGRCYVRRGTSDLDEVQVAFAGARARSSATTGQASVRVLDLATPPAATVAADDESVTELDQLVEACREAAAGRPALRRPWIPPLAEVITVDELPSAGRPSSAAVVIGLTDRPELQRQDTYTVDLAKVGSVLISGASGSGKTTALRTLAAGLAQAHSPRDLHLYGVDFASGGLSALSALPHCAGVITGDDGERAERLVRRLLRTLDERRGAFAQFGVSTINEYNAAAAADQALPRIVVLVDGLGGLRSFLEPIELGALADALPTIAGDGRPLGVHLVLTVAQRAEIPRALLGVVGERIVLRASEEQDYGMFGLAPTAYRGTVLPPGRGFVDDGIDVQVAVVGGPAAEQQRAGLADLGARISAEHPGLAAAPFRPMPTVVTVEEIGSPPRPWAVPLGLGGPDVEPVSVDLSARHLLIAGARRSGRSTALATISAGVLAGVPNIEAHLLLGRTSPVAELAGWTSVARGQAACSELASSLDLAARTAADEPLFLAVDDVDLLDDYAFTDWLERAARLGPERGIHLAVTITPAAAARAPEFLRIVLQDQLAVVLPGGSDVADLYGVRLPRRNPPQPIPGRALLLVDGSVSAVQCATVTPVGR